MTSQEKKILVSCPLCKVKKLIQIPPSVIEGKKELTTISIPKGKICDHHFQIFVDRHYIIRGYQKVDYELSDYHSTNQNSLKLLSEPLKDKKNGNKGAISKKALKQKDMSLKEIYEEFWEYISIDNEEFKTFITKDIRRKDFLNNIKFQRLHSMDLSPHVCKKLE